MASLDSSGATLSSTPEASLRRITKRKIDDALYNLEQALRSSDEVQRPPSKKMRFPSSLYSTLAKYGIKTKRSLTSDSKAGQLNIIKKQAPHLSAILSREASRKEKAGHREELARASVAHLSATNSQSTTIEYRPSSITSFLSRLSTFKLATYSSKPISIDAVAASKAGWINEGKERLLCGICKASWVLAPRDGMARDAANALVEKQRVSLVEMHKDNCPWRTRQCDDSIYCIPLKSPSMLAKEIKSNALELDDKKVLEGVELRHPLTSGQVQALQAALSTVKLPAPDSDTTEIENPSSDAHAEEHEAMQVEPSQNAALTAVFGWSIVHPNMESRPTTPSAIRASSISHGTALSNGMLQAAQNTSISEAGFPKPSRIPVARTASATASKLQRRGSTKKREEALLHCVLCQRRVGLWAFKTITDNSSSTSLASPAPSTPAASAPSTNVVPAPPPVPESNGPSRIPVRRVSHGPIPNRQLDLLKEHRSYCPYVVRSTTVPTLSSLANTPHIRSVSADHTSHPQRPTPMRSSSASSLNFSFSPRHAPPYPEPGTSGSLTDPGAVEGWRAVLTMVMRSGFGRRQRQRAILNVKSVNQPSVAGASHLDSRAIATSPSATNTETTENSDAMEIDNIHAIVEEVKARGGKNLLRYVKNLFA